LIVQENRFTVPAAMEKVQIKFYLEKRK